MINLSQTIVGRVNDQSSELPEDVKFALDEFSHPAFVASLQAVQLLALINGIRAIRRHCGSLQYRWIEVPYFRKSHLFLSEFDSFEKDDAMHTRCGVGVYGEFGQPEGSVRYIGVKPSTRCKTCARLEASHSS